MKTSFNLGSEPKLLSSLFEFQILKITIWSVFHVVSRFEDCKQHFTGKLCRSGVVARAGCPEMRAWRRRVPGRSLSSPPPSRLFLPAAVLLTRRSGMRQAAQATDDALSHAFVVASVVPTTLSSQFAHVLAVTHQEDQVVGWWARESRRRPGRPGRGTRRRLLRAPLGCAYLLERP